ncbi:MAG: hypothetical protein WEB60_09085, partial [Terrimicrobiaceae bacterium]
MINPALNIAWSIAEVEASAAGFDAILPAHFWIGCCKGCDLDLARFLAGAAPEIKGQERHIADAFGAVNHVLASAHAKPSALRRALRVR